MINPACSPILVRANSVDECFVFDGLVSLMGNPTDQHLVCILRDTACSQSVVLASALPFSDQSACGYGAVLRGVEMGFALRPVHCVHVESNLITCFFPVAVCPELPIKGIDFSMGNDVAGGKVTPTLEVLYTPLRVDDGKISQTELELYPACASFFRGTCP